MFPARLEHTQQGIAAVKKSVEISDQIRGLLLTGTECLSNLVTAYPDNTDWRIYDHCAALTRLYAIFESFVEGILSDFLGALPSLFRYADLGEGFHKEHRDGVAYILKRIETYRYRDLRLSEVIKEYNRALSGEDEYRILSHSLLAHEQNLYLPIVENLFARLGMKNVIHWITHHPRVKTFMNDVRGEQNTVESELKSFVQYRNEAAHGSVNDVLGKEELLIHCDFIAALCQAMYELVNHQVISRRLELAMAREVGRVTEEYHDNIIVALLKNTTVEIDDRLYFMSDSYCYSSAIVSLQVDDVDTALVTVTEAQEIGLKTTVKVKKKARVIDCGR
jgi:hypothetical protein